MGTLFLILDKDGLGRHSSNKYIAEGTKIPARPQSPIKNHCKHSHI